MASPPNHEELPGSRQEQEVPGDQYNTQDAVSEIKRLVISAHGEILEAIEREVRMLREDLHLQREPKLTKDLLKINVPSRIGAQAVKSPVRSPASASRSRLLSPSGQQVTVSVDSVATQPMDSVSFLESDAFGTVSFLESDPFRFSRSGPEDDLAMSPHVSIISCGSRVSRIGAPDMNVDEGLECFRKLIDVQEIERQYDSHYRAFRQSEHWVSIPSRGEQTPLQPTSCDTEDGIYAKAHQAQPLFCGILMVVCERAALILDMAPIKLRSRAREKVHMDYNGDWRRLLDVLRASVICDSPDQIDHCLETLATSGATIVRVKSSLTDAPASLSTGYRDVKCNITINGIIGEVQFHMRALKALNDDSHLLYSWARKFSSEGIRNPVQILWNVSPELLGGMVAKARSYLSGREHLIWRSIVVQLLILKSDHGSALEEGLELLQACIVRYGDRHLAVARANYLLGKVYTSHKKPGDARRYYERALQLRLTILGNEHLSTAESQLALGLSCTMSKDFDSARQNLDHCFQTRQKILGLQHLDVGECYVEMARLHQALACEAVGTQRSMNARRAVDLGRQALNIQTKILGKMHIEVAKTQNIMGGAHKLMGENRNALQCFEKVLGIRKDRLGVSTTSVADVQISKAEVHENEGDLEEAISLFESAVNTYRMSYGEQHAATVKARRTLISLREVRVSRRTRL